MQSAESPDTPGSSSGTDSAAVVGSDQAAVALWREQLLCAIDRHFDAARERVTLISRRHFVSLGAVLSRHWQHRRDVPADLLALPRGVWHLLTRRGEQPRQLTGKELAVAELMATEVLDLPGLENLLLAHLRRHPDYVEGQADALQAELAPLDHTEATRRLQQAVAQWGQRHDSNRELLLFLAIGLLGRGLGDKVLFGSASVLGMSAAGSLYLSQQGWLAGLWANWFGLPGWVTATGAVGGVLVMIAAAPLLSPFVEYGFNRLGARRRLLRMVDEVHRELRKPLSDQLWRLGGYLQFIPDLLQCLRLLR